MVYFSTLEDAWGTTNINVSNKKKSKSKSQVDPLCELYGKRYSKVSKPYSSSTLKGNSESSDYKNNLEPYNKNDFTRSMKNSYTKKNTRQEYYPIELDEYSTFASVKGIDDDSDDSYLSNALENININDNNEMFDDEEDNHELDDCVDDESENENENENTNESKIALSQVNTKNKNSHVTAVTHVSEEKSNNDNYLDLSLYIASGIILIFLCEQILQLGMKMKIN